ncbi:MAG TPA: metalloregulator ArsR/SmtB family transcription factor [Dehalococcoidia bacterium]|nr:metalloregulator ArsR/SmtB family transcription factor [Dehalococcoidia bacterium]
MTTQIQELKVTDRPWRASSCCPAEPAVRPAENSSDMVEVLKALADETRLGIVKMLAAHDEPLCVCHIVDAFELSQPTISHHLKLLREAGLISSEKRGLWAYYSLERSKLSTLANGLPLPAAVCAN